MAKKEKLLSLLNKIEPRVKLYGRGCQLFRFMIV